MNRSAAGASVAWVLAGVTAWSSAAWADANTATKIAAEDGTPVTFTSTRLDTVIYLARGDVGAHAEPDPFERLGVAPVTVKLTPGKYSVEAESPTTSNGHSVFYVENQPLRVVVRPGDELVKLTGTLFTGLGVTALLLGVVVIVSVSPHDQNFDRWGLGLPLVFSGVGGLGLGIVLSSVGSTRVVLPPGSAQGMTVGVRVRF